MQNQIGCSREISASFHSIPRGGHVGCLVQVSRAMAFAQVTTPVELKIDRQLHQLRCPFLI